MQRAHPYDVSKVGHYTPHKHAAQHTAHGTARDGRLEGQATGPLATQKYLSAAHAAALE